MAERYLDIITPDSLSGLIFGFEGIRKALVILNGPTGCKFFHSITAENQSVHKDDYDPLNYPDEWFFGQRRVPCTYLDRRDYVYGSEGKLADAIRFILGRITPDVLIVVNSPGAALIGDDLERIVNSAVRDCGFIPDQDPGGTAYGQDDADNSGAPGHITVITCQSPGYSKDVIDGYTDACRITIDKCCAGKEGHEAAAGGDSPVVNLLGLSIYQKYHTGDVAEIMRLLALCGIRVNTALLCESTPEELRRIPDAALNIVIDTDWGISSAEYLEEKYGTPYIYSEYGYPVGFKAMEKLICDVCSRMSSLRAPREDVSCGGHSKGHDMRSRSDDPDSESFSPRPALKELEKARARAYVQLARISSITGLPKGTRFAVYGSPAAKRGYSAFLTEYLGMSESENDPQTVLADGNTIARMKAEGKRFSGIETSLPSIGYIDVIDKTHLGASGGLFLIEQILNSFVY